jgi:hypothetical protein
MIAAGIVILTSLLTNAPSNADIAKAENLSSDGWKLWMLAVAPKNVSQK